MSDTPVDASVRVRFAPSPTGFLHIGGLRTALYNYLFARRHGGRFIVRIEDTDRERYVEGAEDDILASLRWAGITCDEGPDVGGPVGPYRQSERRDLYQQYIQPLLEAGHAYYAFDTPEELDAMREEARQRGEAGKYDATTRLRMKNALTLPEAEVQRRLDAGEPYVVRLRVPAGEVISFHDHVRGTVSIDAGEVDDQVLIKSDGMPTYHFANVVDDHLMGITHVIRGEEWLPSTPKHVLLYRFLGWEVPQMAHLPLILSPTGGKLSKRKAEAAGIPVFVKDYRAQGYDPEALVNFLAFLGWNPGDERELFTLDELARVFSLDRVGNAGVQFNMDKLAWYNQQYLRQRPVEDLVEAVWPHVRAQGYEVDRDYVRAVVGLMRERVTFPQEIVTEAPYFFEDPAGYDEAGVKKRWKADSADLLAAYADRLEALETFDEATAEATLRALAEERGVGAGRLIHPVRLALSGVTYGPGLFELMHILGRDACVRRIRRAVEVLGSAATA
ncbi:MAG: glutamate--tRNA ligase [Bacteroidetes bacterium]|nr:MAG: glutamate--tRNA ligase [Bacteroidota bacterium]